MATDERACTSCDTPLPEGAMFCPACGAATPTEISQETGTPRPARKSDVDTVEFQERLQRVLGEDYELGELVGTGGFAEVYAARDVRLKRDVAVKVLRSDLIPSKTTLERFRREAEAIAQLRHPNIIPVYTVGEGEGLVYFVMPLIKGESLGATLQRKERLPTDEVQRILREAAGALHEAHEAGIVHRDIKPENIMLEGAKRRVLVMDFGIAKAVGGEQGEGLTVAGAVVGTPHYMSPEQASGEREIDPRSDQYSLAVVGYRMLTGTFPFSAKTPESIIYHKIAETPKPAYEVHPDAPRLLSDALHRAMTPDPNERFGSMEEFAAAVSGAAVAPPEAAAAAPVEAIAGARAPVISLRTAGLGAVGLLAFVLLYRTAFPPAIGRPDRTRKEATSIARDFFLAHAGAAGAFGTKEAIRFHQFSNERQFLERTLGLAGARRWAQEEGLIGHWDVRWFRPLQIEEWRVEVDGDGMVNLFQHTVEETAPGADLEQDAALAIADSFLQARGWDVGTLEMRESSAQSRPNRTDHSFTWEKRGSRIAEDEDDDEATAASVHVAVRVQGDQIGRYERELDVPEQFSRELDAARKSSMRAMFMALLMIGGILLALGILIAQLARQRAKEMQWIPALVLSGLLIIGFFAENLNRWPNTKYSYSTDQSWAMFLFSDWVVFPLLGGVFLLGAFFLAVTVGEYLGRQTFPDSLAGYVEALRGRLLTPAMVRAGVTGSALGLVLLGYTAAFRAAAGKIPGVWDLTTANHADSLDYSVPLLSALFDPIGAGIAAGVGILFIVALLKRYLKSTAVAVGLPALVGGLLNPAVYPTYIGALGSAIPILIVALVFIRFGVLACMVAVFVQECVSSSMTMLTSGESGLVVSGILLLLLALLPASLLVIARSRAARVPAMAP